jgi:hypothetical protein
MNVSLYLVGSLEWFIFVCECLIFICNSRVRCRVRVTRRVEFTRAGAGMEAFSYPCAITGNPTGTTWRVRMRVRVATARRVRTVALDFWVLTTSRAQKTKVLTWLDTYVRTYEFRILHAPSGNQDRLCSIEHAMLSPSKMFLPKLSERNSLTYLLHSSQNICRFYFLRNNFNKIYIKKY